MERLHLPSSFLGVTLLTLGLASGSLAAAPANPAAPDPVAPNLAAADSHAADLRLARDWWEQGTLAFPAPAAQRLADWVKDHPRDGESLYRLALLRSRNGPTLPRNTSAAVDLLTRAVEAGYDGARARLGLWKLTGKDMPRDEAGGHQLLDPLVAKEDPEALLCLGVAMLPSTEADVEGFARAETLLRRALELGNAKAHAWVAASCFRYGTQMKGFAVLQDGIRTGDVYCKTRLALEYLSLGQSAKLLDDARRLLREAAEWGDIDAQTQLGRLCRRAEMSNFRAEGTRWLQVAAKGQDRTAGYHLATAYLRGEGTAADAAWAVVTLT